MKNGKKSFVEQVRGSRNTLLHIYRTYNSEGRACWYLIRANERQIISLSSTKKTDVISLKDYAEVLGAGWGHDVYDEDIQRIIDN